MAAERERVLETVAEPDVVYQGDEGALLAVRQYRETPRREVPGGVYRELSTTDGFIVTAYFTNRPARGREVVWKRSES
jgi:hypothetical protein